MRQIYFAGAIVIASFLLLTGCSGSGGDSKSDADNETAEYADDAAELYCTPESRKCLGSDVNKCNATGTEWEFFKTCDSGLVCLNGDCAAATENDGDIDEDDSDVEDVAGDDSDIETILEEQPDVDIDETIVADGDDEIEDINDEEQAADVDDNEIVEELPVDIDPDVYDDNVTEIPDETTDDNTDIEDEVEETDGETTTITFTRIGNLHTMPGIDSFIEIKAEAADGTVPQFSVVTSIPASVKFIDNGNGSCSVKINAADSEIGKHYLVGIKAAVGSSSKIEMMTVYIHAYNPVENDTCSTPTNVEVGDVLYGTLRYAKNDYKDKPVCSSFPENIPSDYPEVVYRVNTNGAKRVLYKARTWGLVEYAIGVINSSTCADAAQKCFGAERFVAPSDKQDAQMIYEIPQGSDFYYSIVEIEYDFQYDGFYYRLEIEPYDDKPKGYMCLDPIPIPSGSSLSDQSLDGFVNTLDFTSSDKCLWGNDAHNNVDLNGPQLSYMITGTGPKAYRIEIEPLSSSFNPYFFVPIYCDMTPEVHCDRFWHRKQPDGKAIVYAHMDAYIETLGQIVENGGILLTIGDYANSAQGLFNISVFPEDECDVIFSRSILPEFIDPYWRGRTYYTSILKIESLTIVIEVNHPAQQEISVTLSNADNFGVGDIWQGEKTVLYNGENSGQFGRKVFNVSKYNGRVLSGWTFDIIVDDNIDNSNNGTVTTHVTEINRDKCLNRPCYDDNDCPISNMKCHATQKKCVLK